MNKKYVCYCGMYCENCVVKAQVEPASIVLHDIINRAGFEEVAHNNPDGARFLRFLKLISEKGACTLCHNGSGNPVCAVRVCAKEKEIDMCAFCDDYPCDKLNDFFKVYPVLKDDNDLLREKGMEKWIQMQEERKENGYVYKN